MIARAYTDLVVLHCSDTKPSQDHVNEAEIRRWHIERGWSDAGYNIVIPRKPSHARSGYIEVARPLDYRGAHVRTYNHRSLGICLVGGMSENGEPEDNFLPQQWAALSTAVDFALEYAPQALVVGHYELDEDKTCPNFNVPVWARRHGFPTLRDVT